MKAKRVGNHAVGLDFAEAPRHLEDKMGAAGAGVRHVEELEIRYRSKEALERPPGLLVDGDESLLDADGRAPDQLEAKPLVAPR
jgi:hypothetical protein